SHPVLFVGNPHDFRDFVDTSLNSSPLRFFLSPFGPHIKEFRIVLAGRQNHASHLSIPYWSTTPYLFGEGRAVKYSVKSCDQSNDAEPPRKLMDGYLRAAMREQMDAAGACFDFLVQFQTDAELMPIEDATVEWDETLSPFRKVARIHIPPQSFESPEQMEFCENLAFNPWQSLPDHRPLGGINRVRKDLYKTLAEFRHQANGANYEEPDGNESF
ncbi:MAG: catalase, partial [Xanthomonadales bacterium]|nr:catalase [Xanthomonadales bacterium]